MSEHGDSIDKAQVTLLNDSSAKEKIGNNNIIITIQCRVGAQKYICMNVRLEFCVSLLVLRWNQFMLM